LEDGGLEKNMEKERRGVSLICTQSICGEKALKRLPLVREGGGEGTLPVAKAIRVREKRGSRVFLRAGGRDVAFLALAKERREEKKTSGRRRSGRPCRRRRRGRVPERRARSIFPSKERGGEGDEKRFYGRQVIYK